MCIRDSPTSIDYAGIGIKLNDQFSLFAGKQCAAYGGIELDVYKRQRLVCVNSMHAAFASLVSGWSLDVINAIIPVSYTHLMVL